MKKKSQKCENLKFNVFKNEGILLYRANYLERGNKLKRADVLVSRGNELLIRSHDIFFSHIMSGHGFNVFITKPAQLRFRGVPWLP